MSSIDITASSAQEVFSLLGSGHSENVYETAMDIELKLQGILDHRRQVPCVLIYKHQPVGTGFIDILVNNYLIVEIKAIAKLTNKDEQQVRKYLAATGLNHGLLINFGNELEIVQVHPVDCYINDDPSFPNHVCGRLPHEEGNYDETPSAESGN